MAWFKVSRNCWEERAVVTMPDGSRKRVSFYGKTEEEAIRKANRATTPLLANLNTVKGFAMNVYLPSVQSRRYKTKEQIVYCLNKHIFPVLGHQDLTDITRADVQRFLNTLAATTYRRSWERTGKDGKKETVYGKEYKLSAWTLKHVRKVLFGVFQLAEIDGVIQRNPVAHTRVPEVREARKTIYTPEQCAALINQAKGTPMEAPLILALFAGGCRCGEALGLLRSDIQDGVIILSEQLQRQKLNKTEKARLVRVPLKTTASARRIPLPDSLRIRLEGTMTSASMLVCPGVSGAFISPDSVNKALYALEDAAELPRASFHELRSTFISNLESVGCPGRTVRELSGHAARDVNEAYNRSNDSLKRHWLGILWLAAFPEAKEKPALEVVESVASRD